MRTHPWHYFWHREKSFEIDIDTGRLVTFHVHIHLQRSASSCGKFVLNSATFLIQVLHFELMVAYHLQGTVCLRSLSSFHRIACSLAWPNMTIYIYKSFMCTNVWSDVTLKETCSTFQIQIDKNMATKWFSKLQLETMDHKIKSAWYNKHYNERYWLY